MLQDFPCPITLVQRRSVIGQGKGDGPKSCRDGEHPREEGRRMEEEVMIP